MTGEITLRGEILPVGGLREKILAARSAGIASLVLPKANQRDLAEIPEQVQKGLTFHFPGHVEEALAHALKPPASDKAPGEATPSPRFEGPASAS